jgi:hypothetical protein
MLMLPLVDSNHIVKRSYGKVGKSKRLGRDHNRFNENSSVLGAKDLSRSGNP